MKRQISVGMLLAVGLFIWGAGHPEQALSDKPCSLRTLKGTYLYHCAGVQGSGQVHFAFAGKDQYNGDGTMTGVFSYSDKGNILHHVSYTGTYTVNPDCTGAYTTMDENGVVGHARSVLRARWRGGEFRLDRCRRCGCRGRTKSAQVRLADRAPRAACCPCETMHWRTSRQCVECALRADDWSSRSLAPPGNGVSLRLRLSRFA